MPNAVKGTFKVEGNNCCNELQVHPLRGLLLKRRDLFRSSATPQVGRLLRGDEVSSGEVQRHSSSDEALQQFGDSGGQADRPVVATLGEVLPFLRDHAYDARLPAAGDVSERQRGGEHCCKAGEERERGVAEHLVLDAVGSWRLSLPKLLSNGLELVGNDVRRDGIVVVL